VGEFLTDALRWYFRHQPVWPFPFVMAFLGSFWASQAAQFVFADSDSAEEKFNGNVTFGGAFLYAFAVIVGFLTGHWYFLVPLTTLAVITLPVALAFHFAARNAFSPIVFTEGSLHTLVGDTEIQRPAPAKASMKPRDVIRKCEKIVDTYRKTVPVDELTGGAWERADAKLRALRELYALLEKLESVQAQDTMAFDAIVTEADALYRDVPIERSLIEHYRSQRTELGPTITSVKLAIESVYLSILNLPNEAKSKVIAEVPTEYLRLKLPDDEETELAQSLPDIDIPRRTAEREQVRQAPYPKLAQ